MVRKKGMQMKGAGKYADELKSLTKKLAKEVKDKGVTAAKPDPLRSLVRSIFAFDTTDAKADEALATIAKEFVDLNELRVATELELLALIGAKYPQIELRSAMANSILNFMFEKEGVLIFDRISNLKKAEIRQYFRDVPGMTPYVEGFLCLFCFDIAAMPLDPMSLAYLRNAGAIDATATLEEAQKFIENHSKPEEMQDLFHGLRRHAKENFLPPAPPAEEKDKDKDKKPKKK